MAGRVSGEEKGQIEKKRREIGSKRKNEKSAKGGQCIRGRGE